MTNYTLNYWLRHLYKFQDKILLCFRQNEKSGWSDRVFYLSEDYEPSKKYNHRNILESEVVIEFDAEKKEDNWKYADEVCDKLKKDNISFSKWDSGNKSIHIHTFFDFKDARNIPLLKNTIMRYYSKGLPILPDLRLVSPNHLIRAEHGLHEKTQKYKSLIRRSGEYPKLNIIPDEVWKEYQETMRTIVRRKLTTEVNDIVEHPGLKWILTAEQFREANDGRERALFMLIHILKPKYKEDKEGLVKFLQDWYKYSGGTKLSAHQIKCKVEYHWNREYTFGERFINELLEDLGRKDLVVK